jgi:tetratricopeptide (TPR) repeat protein
MVPAKPAGGVPVWTLACVLVLLVGAFFAQTREFGFINYDTPAQVSDNPEVLDGLTAEGIGWAFSSGSTGNWIPITRISHMIDVSLFGLDSGSHHLTSVLIHAANTVLLFFLLFSVSGHRWRSFLVAVVFAIHPLHVESVTWINQRKDVLSAFFVLLSILAYGRYAQKPGVWRYGAVAALFACALMSKPMAVTLPLLLILLDVWPLGRLARSAQGRQSRFAPLSSLTAALIEKVPLIAVAAGISAVTFMAQQSAGAVSGFEGISLLARVSNAFVSYGVYIAQTVWPAGLSVFYPMPVQPMVGAAVATALALLVAGLIVVRVRSQHPYLVVGFAWFLVTLLPVLGLIRVGLGAHADRYMYLAQSGLVVAVVWFVADFLRTRPHLRSAAVTASVAVCLALGVAAWRQLGHWRSTSALFEHALAVTEDNAVAHHALGYQLRAAGRVVEAAEHFAKALAIWPGYSRARNNLGEILFSQGRVAEAEAQFRAAITANSDRAFSHANLGTVLRAQGRFDEAVEAFEEAIRLRPDFGPPHMGLALAHESAGRKNDAIAAARAALRLAPDDADMRAAGKRMFLRLGLLDEAAHLMDRGADDIDAERLHFEAGNAFVGRKRFGDAVEEYRRAAALGSSNPRLYANLGAALASIGRYQEAVEAFNDALRLDPTLAEVKQNLQLALELIDSGGGLFSN